MALAVKLEVFEGPLDLLLHLIDKNKIDIYDIPIAEITEQYMDYIRRLETNDMNVMSEFLLMAATLLEIKSKMLLPKEENGEAEEDPRDELVQKLLEYKMYKYMALELKDRETDAGKNYYKAPTVPKEVAAYQEPVDYDKLFDGIDLRRLHAIFQETMKRQKDKIDPIRSQFGKIEKDEINMDEKLVYIQDYIRSHKRFSFRKLLERSYNKMEIVITFLTVLEMMKIGQITIEQENLFDDIIITSNEAGEEIMEIEDEAGRTGSSN